MHRIAPQPSLPEFYVEVGYLNSLSMLWKLHRAPVYESALGKLDFEFLAQWQVYRRPLSGYCHAEYIDVRRVKAIICECLKFVDALVSDWYLSLSGKEPTAPLDIARLEAFNQHTRKLESIPGEKWEIKY